MVPGMLISKSVHARGGVFHRPLEQQVLEKNRVNKARDGGSSTDPEPKHYDRSHSNHPGQKRGSGQLTAGSNSIPTRGGLVVRRKKGEATELRWAFGGGTAK